MNITRRPTGTAAGEHLGDRVSALVDAALDPREHERLLAHVAGCPACRMAVDGERAAKAWVSRLSQPEIGVALTATLLTLQGSSPPAARAVPVLTAVQTEPRAGHSELRLGLPVGAAATRSGRSSVRTFAALSGAGATAAAVLFVGAAAAPATGVVAASGVASPLTTPVAATTVAAAPTLTLTQAAASMTDRAATMPMPPALAGAPTPLVAVSPDVSPAVSPAVSTTLRPTGFAVSTSVISTPMLRSAVGAVVPGVTR